MPRGCNTGPAEALEQRVCLPLPGNQLPGDDRGDKAQTHEIGGKAGDGDQKTAAEPEVMTNMEAKERHNFAPNNAAMQKARRAF